jgi:hypothetical protein
MNPSPWPPELPALPKELLTPVASAQPVVAAAQKPATSSVPPLIISGKKREPAPMNPASTKLEVSATPVPTNRLASAEALPPSQPASVLSSNNAPVDRPAPASSALITSTPTTSRPGPIEGSSPAPDTRQPVADSSPGQHGSSQVVAAPATNSRDGASAPGGLVASSPLAAQPSDRSEHKETPAMGSPPISNREPVQVATTVPVNRSIYHVTLIFMGLVSLLAIGATVWFWRMRARRTHETSLITESLDHREQ